MDLISDLHRLDYQLGILGGRLVRISYIIEAVQRDGSKLNRALAKKIPTDRP